MSTEEISPISYPLSPISYLERPQATTWRAGVLVGPTAVGKSDVAQWIAEHLGVPILSADSMLVYRGMDIGTAKPTPAERGNVPYFGIDCVGPGEPFSTGAWLSFVRRQLEGQYGIGGGAGAMPPSVAPRGDGRTEFGLIVAGGTGLYIRALLFGLDAPPSDAVARARWTALFESGGLPALRAAVDANPAARALLSEGDLANPRRLIRALERAEARDAPSGSGGAGASPPSVAPSGDCRTVFGQLGGGTSEAREPPGLAAPARNLALSGGPISRDSGLGGAGASPPWVVPSGDGRSPSGQMVCSAVAGLTMPRAMLAARIERRIDKMFQSGLVEEAVAVREASGGLSSTACGAIGYAEALAVADGKMTRAEAAERIAARTRQLAKRQFTWFRHQLNVEWVEVGETDTPATLGPKVLEVWKRNGYFEI